jgi:integrase
LRLIIAALETCCREGELLSLQWSDVSLDRRELFLRAAKTKDREDRVIPISRRLRAVFRGESSETAKCGWGSWVLPTKRG